MDSQQVQTPLTGRTVTIKVTREIDSFIPESGATGTKVTIKGQSASGVTKATFNSDPALVMSDNPCKITAQAPTAAAVGLITATAPSGTATSTEPFT